MIREELLRKFDEQSRSYKEVFDRLEGVIDVTGDKDTMKVKKYLECVLNKNKNNTDSVSGENSSTDSDRPDEWIDEPEVEKEHCQLPKSYKKPSKGLYNVGLSVVCVVLVAIIGQMWLENSYF